MILDGEIVAFDADGEPSFNAMQNRSRASRARVFYCFDLLHFAGVDLRKAPYADRRRYLAQCLAAIAAGAAGPRRRTTAWRCTRRRSPSGFEGVIGKRKDSRYEAGKRSAAWLKVKSTQQRRLRDRRLHEGQGRARAAGRVAGRLLGGRQAAVRLACRLRLRRRSLCAGARSSSSRCGARPIRSRPNRRAECARRPGSSPKLVAEVKFQGWTDDGHRCARRCSCGCATTSRPKEVRRTAPAGEAQGTADSEIDEVLRQLDNEQGDMHASAVGAHTLKLTHLDRVYWPADPALQAAGADQARPAALLRAGVAVHAAAPR